MKAIIVDDEIEVRAYIRDLIDELDTVKINLVGEAGDVLEAVKLINKTKPDLLLLDIQLGKGTSFEILDCIDPTQFHIVFITGYDHMAIKALKIGALDYILKPIDEDEFEQAIEKVNQVHKEQQNKIGQYVPAKDFYAQNTIDQIALATSGSTHVVRVRDIMYCKSEGNYTTFFLDQQPSIMISKPLKFAISILPDQAFVRTHQSYLVHRTYVDKILKSGSVLLHDDTELPISNSYRSHVNDFFKKQ